MVYTTHVWWFWGWCTIVLPTLPRVMETHEYHHDPLKKQIFLHNSWLCSHVFPRNNETRGGFEFPPNKKQLQLFNHKKIFMEIFSKAPLEKKSGSCPSRNSSPARPAQRYLPFQAMDVIEVSGSACAWWSAGTMREGLPEGMPRLQVRMGKHWENIGKTLENIRKLEKHWKNSGDLKQVVVRSLGYHWKKSLG